MSFALVSSSASERDTSLAQFSMSPFIHIPCSCGKSVRVRQDLAGTSVRCWGCGNEVRVPELHFGGRLAEMFAKTFQEVLSPTHCFAAVGMGLVMATLLSAPRVGLILGVAFALVMSWYYQDNMERAGLDYARLGDEIEPLQFRDRAMRVALGFLALCALFTPLYFRNWGHLLPGVRTYPLARTLMLAAFSTWFITPLVLLAFNARDARGRLSPWSVVRVLARHPFATLASLLILPLGFAAIEFFAAVVSWYEGVMPLMVADLFPTPSVKYVDKIGRELHFFYDDLHPVDRPVSVLVTNAFPDYFRAVSRGFFLTGTIPESLPTGYSWRFDPSFFDTQRETYFWFRFVFAAIILAAVGCVLAVQSVWLGLIVALGSRRTALEGTSLAIHAESRETEPASAVEAKLPSIPSAWSGLLLRPAVDSSANPSPVPALPLVHTSPSAAEFNGSPSAAQAATRRTILIIDDERAFAHAIARILAERGYAVLVAGGAEDGLRQARVGHPALIVLDLLLPDRSGIEVCRQLRSEEHTRNTPIIVTTYKTSAEDEIGALESGADDFVGKPYVVEVLIARIERQIARGKPIAAPHA
jgi:CheY-like chemotaxis protein